MNERIEELAKQADIEVAHIRSDRLRTDDEIKRQWIEKFAELIVKDITTEVKMGIESSTINLESSPPDSGGIHYWEGYRHASDDILVYIKEHFGVE